MASLKCIAALVSCVLQVLAHGREALKGATADKRASRDLSVECDEDITDAFARRMRRDDAQSDLNEERARSRNDVPPAEADGEAKRSWLAKVDVHEWKQEASHTTEEKRESAGTTEAAVKAAWLAKVDRPQWGSVPAASATQHASLPAAPVNEAAAKAAWLSKLDAPVWGTAAVALSEVSADATAMAALSEQCDDGDSTACDALSREDEAKAAWLSKLDAPSWGVAAQAVSELSVMARVIAQSPSASAQSEAAAKAAWLSKLDAPSWGKAAQVMTELVAEATQIQALNEQCDSGETRACDTLSREEEAKRTWLSKLDVPQWGSVASTVSEVATGATTDATNCPTSAHMPQVAIDALRTASKAVVQLIEQATVMQASTKDVQTWSKVAATLSEVADDAASSLATATPTAMLQKATKDMVDVVSLAADVQARVRRCSLGDDTACKSLAQAQESQYSWLTELDVDSWWSATVALSKLTTVLQSAGTPTGADSFGSWLHQLSGAEPNANASTEAAVVSAATLKATSDELRAASDAVLRYAVRASDLQGLVDRCEAGDKLACEAVARRDEVLCLGTRNVMMWFKIADTLSRAADDVTTSQTPVTSASVLQKSAQSMLEDVSAATEMQFLTHRCSVGDDLACASLGGNDEGQVQRLMDVDVESWSAAASAILKLSTVLQSPSATSDAEAIGTWLKELSAPEQPRAVGKVVPTTATSSHNSSSTVRDALCAASQVLSNMVTQASDLQVLRLHCEAGNDAACDALSLEKEGAHVSFAMTDVPRWSKVATTLLEVAEGLPPSATAAMLATTVRDTIQAMRNVARQASEMQFLVQRCISGDSTALGIVGREDDANVKWLTELDVQSWEAAALTLSKLSQELNSAGETSGVEIIGTWLQGLDAEIAAALSSQAVGTVVPTSLARTSLQDMALAKSHAAAALKLASGVVWSTVSAATECQSLTARCKAGDRAACDALSTKDDGTRLRLSAYDRPMWAKVAASLSQVAADMSSTEGSSLATHDLPALELLLANLDALAWSKAADALQVAASDMREVVAKAPDLTSASMSASEIDVSSWHAASRVVDELSEVARSAPLMSAHEVIATWLQKLAITEAGEATSTA